jgi:hypothetical protein
LTDRANPPDIAEKSAKKILHIVAEWNFIYPFTISFLQLYLFAKAPPARRVRRRLNSHTPISGVVQVFKQRRQPVVRAAKKAL